MTRRSSIDTIYTLPEHSSFFYENYEDHIFLGKGGFGTVFQATEKNSGCKVAIKRIELQRGTEEKVLHELKILSKLDHGNILRYHNSWTESTTFHEKYEEKVPVTSSSGGFSFAITNGSSASSTHMVKIPNDHINLSHSSVNIFDDEDIVFLSPSQETQLSQQTKSSSVDESGTTSNDQPSSSTKSEQTNEKKSIVDLQKSDRFLFIVTGLCENNSLRDRLLYNYRSQNIIDRIEALHIFYQIVNGLMYLHNEKNLIHCDLKPANILFSLFDETVKIADFGLVKTTEDLQRIEKNPNLNKNYKTHGTPSYIPPNAENISDKRDIYALGIILVELLYPFSTGSERAKVLKDIRQASVIFPDDFNEKCGNELMEKLISRLVSHSPNNRPTANDLDENLRRDIGINDFIRLNGRKVQKTLKANQNTTISKLEHVLNASAVKELRLSSDEIQFGVYDTSDKYLLLSDDHKLKLYDINCVLIDEYVYLHDYYKIVGNIQRIVWCQSLRQFFILCKKFLYVFAPDQTTNLGDMKKVYNINTNDTNDQLRFISCTNDHVYINRSYHTIQQYKIAIWYLNCTWSRKDLNYNENDEIRRTTCSTTDNYIAFNVRLNGHQWVVDIRCTETNLTLLKRIEASYTGIYHHLQLSSYEWLLADGQYNFYLSNVLEEESNLKLIRTNMIKEHDIYPRLFGEYLIVPLVVPKLQKEPRNSVEHEGIIYFYQWQ